MRNIDRPITFGLLVATRGFFNAEYVGEARRQLTAAVAALGHRAVIPPAEATPTGGVETIADANTFAQLMRAHPDGIDGIVVALPNFGDEIGVVEAISRSGLKAPVLVQASDDIVGKGGLADRRDSFCGKLSVCNNLRQYGIKFSLTSRHTWALDSEGFKTDLASFASLCRVVRGLRQARIGAIGARTGAFQTVRFSEKLLQASGLTVVTVDLSEILGAAEKVSDSDADLTDKLKAIAEYGTIPSYIQESAIRRQAKFSIAVDRWIAENECDASCIQCWTSLQNNYGCASCLTMSMMGEALAPSACEVDVMGAVSMYALTLATRVPAALLDWNNNYGDELEKCVATHCGNFPKSFMGETPEISELDIIGKAVGKAKCFGAVKGRVQPGAFTYFRASTDDTSGRVRFYAGEGSFTDDVFPMDGGIAVCDVPRMQLLLRMLCNEGYEHHVAMVRGHAKGILAEAAGKYLGWAESSF